MNVLISLRFILWMTTATLELDNTQDFLPPLDVLMVCLARVCCFHF